MIDFLFLLTDFGVEDPYVSQMKMVVLSEVKCHIIDISHNILPFNIIQGAFFLKASWKFLPTKSLCLVVVDPGVGTSRDIIVCLGKGNRYVLAPDNGIVSWILDEILKVFKVDVLPFKEVSNTFHGRDIFAPLAIKMIKGKGDSVLKEISKRKIKKIDFPKPVFEGKKIKAQIIHIDRFGNCVLSIASEWKDFLFSKDLSLEIPRVVEVVPSQNYFSIPEGKVGILDGSQGFLELAMNMNSCKEFLGAGVGDECVFKIK